MRNRENTMARPINYTRPAGFHDLPRPVSSGTAGLQWFMWLVAFVVVCMGIAQAIPVMQQASITVCSADKCATWHGDGR